MSDESNNDFKAHSTTFEELKGAIQNYRYYRDFQRFRDTHGTKYFLKKDDPNHDDMIINIKHEGTDDVIALHVRVMPVHDRIKFYSKLSIPLST